MKQSKLLESAGKYRRDERSADLQIQSSNRRYHLLVEEHEEIGWDTLELLVDRSYHGRHRTFDGSDGGSQGSGVALRVIVQIRNADQSVDGSHPHEAQMLQLLAPLPVLDFHLQTDGIDIEGINAN